MPFKVAIVGRPNVGKSSLFNRLVGERLSITDDMPGVTRDRIYAKAEWLTKNFRVIDTGGIDIGDAPFLNQIKAQAQVAMDEADVIVFVVDGKVGLSDSDYYIAKLLYKSETPVILAVNKIDDINQVNNIYEFYALGLSEPIATSAQHGIGIGDLLDRIVSYMKEDDIEYDEDAIRFCVVGRPNVGKSSLTNVILGEERVIVSEISGTTRDAIDTQFKKDRKEYVVIDTAGIKKRGKVYENTDKYSVLRALSALERSDVALLVLDGEEGIIEQDKHVAGYIAEYYKAVVIVVNKWDAVLKDEKTMRKMEKKVKEEFKFLDYAEIVFVSAKDNNRIQTIFPAINHAYDNFQKQIQTSVLNDLMHDAVAMNPTPIFNHGKAQFNYATQVAIKPPTFIMFVNNPDFVHFSYTRYLHNQLREAIDFTGTPIKLILRKKA
ncbi:ribosome biogenesis GTPase Der [Mariniplasma anaerobium]|uniref:GTPase Der n=1 Tax=Mariniplasma anaerobium TaxID=2735436 RepID=A0A7U9TGJ3_9MOLU|nr:ribosome biogenesis GTPase Der [Mariniplasma anaerobium]BCR35673.1 ribosome biogenesis GTPase Der [Mariniplasma anaerobium]